MSLPSVLSRVDLLSRYAEGRMAVNRELGGGMLVALARSVKFRVLLLAFVAGCVGSDGDDDDGASSPTPVPIVVVDQASYTAACEQALGEWPVFDCSEAEEIPIVATLGGVTATVDEQSDLDAAGGCDKPLGIGGGNCLPHNRIGTKINSQGTPFTFICRLYHWADAGDVLFDDLGVIAQSPVTGDTCFWAVPIDGTQFDGSVIPKPGSAEDLAFFDDRPFWYTLDGIASGSCRSCHDNDPYLHTPAVEQMGVVPTQPLLPYRVVAEEELRDRGGSDWLPSRYLVHEDAAPCVACHRLGERHTCEIAQWAAGRTSAQWSVSAEFRAWPRSHWMDRFDDVLTVFDSEAEWDATYGAAVDTIETCCNSPSTPGCWE